MNANVENKTSMGKRKQIIDLIRDGRKHLRNDGVTADRILDLFSVSNCAKCGNEGDGFGLRGELCKGCDHIMRLDAM